VATATRRKEAQAEATEARGKSQRVAVTGRRPEGIGVAHVYPSK